MSFGFGAGVYCKSPRVGNYYPLGKYASAFQAEIYAINACLGENLKMEIENSRMVILSDSQVAIKALSTNSISSELVKECLSNLNALTKHNQVVIGWVPGRKGVPGNEAADKLAREGSTTPPLGPEPAVGISSSLPKGAVHRWMYKRHCE